MRWTVAALLRPVTFVLAIVAGVVVGDHSDSFWYGLLAWLVAMGLGGVLGAIVRNRPQRALYKAIWPASATLYALLFAALGAPSWATFFVSIIAATFTKQALAHVVPGGRRWTSRVEWRRLDLDELLP